MKREKKGGGLRICVSVFVFKFCVNPEKLVCRFFFVANITQI